MDNSRQGYVGDVAFLVANFPLKILIFYPSILAVFDVARSRVRVAGLQPGPMEFNDGVAESSSPQREVAARIARPRDGATRSTCHVDRIARDRNVDADALPPRTAGITA